MKISTNQFLANCESTGQDELATFICDNFIKSMITCNPDMVWMTGSDWLSVMLNDFCVEITDTEMILIPLSGNSDISIYKEYNI